MYAYPSVQVYICVLHGGITAYLNGAVDFSGTVGPLNANLTCPLLYFNIVENIVLQD